MRRLAASGRGLRQHGTRGGAETLAAVAARSTVLRRTLLVVLVLVVLVLASLLVLRSSVLPLNPFTGGT